MSFVILSISILKCYMSVYDTVTNHFSALDKSFLKDLTFQNGFDFLKMDDLFGIPGCRFSVRSFMLGPVIIQFCLTIEGVFSISSVWCCTLAYFVKCPEKVAEFLS